MMHCEMQCVALPRPPRMNRLHLEGATPHRVARFGLFLSTLVAISGFNYYKMAGILINITQVSVFRPHRAPNTSGVRSWRLTPLHHVHPERERDGGTASKVPGACVSGRGRKRGYLIVIL
jgi:hypothetical protein